MLICFDANAEAKRALDALVESNQFRDTSEAISIALVSYEAIQRTSATVSQTMISTQSGKFERLSQGDGRADKSASAKFGPQIPELLFLNSASTAGLRFAKALTPAEAATPSLPPSNWLFGQFNKFLPIKTTCRALLNLMRQKPNGVILDEASEAISQAAWELGDYLYALDRRANSGGKDSLAAAFPTSANKGAVSRIRYSNQFIGDLRQPKQTEGQSRQTKFNGFPAALKFLQCSDGKVPLLELTTAGAEFALLPNPIFDGQGPTQKFSGAEIEFLLAHMERFVPEETSAYISITDAILEGADTPPKVDAFLCERFALQIVEKVENENEITQTFLTTQRTGAISRMVDLNLISRKKAGLNVTYEVTSTGLAFHCRFSKK